MSISIKQTELKIKNQNNQYIGHDLFLNDSIEAKIAEINAAGAAALNGIPASFTATLEDIAPIYSTSAIYSVGDYVIHNGILYRCKVNINIPEPTWSSLKWQKVNLSQELNNLKSSTIQQIENIIANNFAQTYSPNSPYAIGDYVIHDNILYKCNTQIISGEEWTSGHWTQVNVSDQLKKVNNNIAPTYNSNITYQIGDYVVYNNQLYRCTTAITIAEAWTPAHWTAVSLGPAVSNLKSALTYTQDGNIVKFLDNINYLYGTPVDGKYVSYETGNVGTNADWAYYPAFEIEPNTYYYGSYSSGHVAFFDASGDFISGVLINNSPSNPAFKTPATAKTMTYSYLKSSGNQYVIKSIDFPLEYIDALEKMLNDDVNLSISHFTPIASFGKNLFNRFNTIEGYCPDYVDGSKIWRNASYCYCPDYVEVKPSTTYHFNQLCIIAEYDKNKTCVRTNNKTTVASGTITTTTTTKYLKIGTQITKAALLQVEEGNTGTNYQPFGFTLPLCFAPSIKTVSADGTKQFKTISDAVSSASEGDIILVYDGVYTESVKAYSKKLHIIGTNKAKCILTYSGRDYSNPPLEMAKGSVRNITIIATDSGTSGTYNAYCVHIDNENEANEALTFTNVDFINGVHQAVGIGLRHNFTLTFDLCRFKAVDQAALYCHDWETNDANADKTGQKLIVRNCSIINNSASKASIMLQSQELIDEGAEAVFIGNTVINNGGGSLISMTLWAGRTLTNDNFMGSSDWVLSVDSALNSTQLINSSSANLSYTALTPLLSRVANVDGGYCKIDKIVYVNVKFTGVTEHTGTPSVLGGLPKPLTGNAVLSAVRADSGIGSSLQANVLCGIANTSLYVDTLVNNGVYFVTGSYIAE